MKSKLKTYVIQKGSRWVGRKYPEVRTTVLSKEKAKLFYGYYAALHALLDTRDMPGTGRICQVSTREVKELEEEQANEKSSRDVVEASLLRGEN